MIRPMISKYSVKIIFFLREKSSTDFMGSESCQSRLPENIRKMLVTQGVFNSPDGISFQLHCCVTLRCSQVIACMRLWKPWVHGNSITRNACVPRFFPSHTCPRPFQRRPFTTRLVQVKYSDMLAASNKSSPWRSDTNCLKVASLRCCPSVCCQGSCVAEV